MRLRFHKHSHFLTMKLFIKVKVALVYRPSRGIPGTDTGKKAYMAFVETENVREVYGSRGPPLSDSVEWNPDLFISFKGREIYIFFPKFISNLP